MTDARFAEDLQSSKYAFWKTDQLKVTEVRLWDPSEVQMCPDLQPAVAAKSAFIPPPPVLGRQVDLSTFSTPEGIRTGQKKRFNSSNNPQKRVHAHAGPQLQTLFNKMQEQDAASEAAAAAAATAIKPKQTVLPNQIPDARPMGPPVKVYFASKRPPLQAAAKTKVASAPAKKRVTTSNAATQNIAGMTSPTEKIKRPTVDITGLDIHALAAAGKLSSLTIPQLKAVCREHKLAVGGKKGNLEERIIGHLGIHGAASR